MNQALKVIVVLRAFVGIFLAGAITGGALTARFIGRRRDAYERTLVNQQQQERRQLMQDRQQLMQANNALNMQLKTARQQLQQARQGVVRALPNSPGQRQQQRRFSQPEQFGASLMQRFVNQLHLPTEERVKIRPLVYQAQEDLRRLQRDTARNAEVIVEHLEDEISSQLSADQRDRFDTMIENWRQAFQRYNQAMQLNQQLQREREQTEPKHLQNQPASAPPAANPQTPPPAQSPAAPAAPPASNGP